MNERIRELAEQADINIDSFQFSGTPIKYIVGESSLEKFAELIVRESITTLEHRYQWDGDVSDGNEVKKCIAKIKQHFGVES